MLDIFAASIKDGRGNTLHRLRRYEEATVASARAVEEATTASLRNHAQYALGNHAFRRGDLDLASEAYRKVLLADAGDEEWSPAPADLADLHERLDTEWRAWRQALGRRQS